MIVLNVFSKEFRFGLRADSLVLVDFLNVFGSTECRFISAKNAFKKTLGRNYSFANQSRDVLAANALVSSHLDYCNSLFYFCHVSISTSCRVFRIPLPVLSEILKTMLMLHPS